MLKQIMVTFLWIPYYSHNGSKLFIIYWFFIAFFHLCRHWLLVCLVGDISFNIQQYYWSDTITVYESWTEPYDDITVFSRVAILCL